jgi:hypothetical protein
MNLAVLVSALINLAVLAAFYFAKRWIEASVERSVQHKFDEKLEATKSDLRAREAEISSLRDMVLSGSAQRRALLDNRRLLAVERVWAAVGKLAPFVMLSASMAHIKFDVAARYAPTNPNLRKVFDLLANPSLMENLKNLMGSLKNEMPATNEQPFLSPLAWAYFNAYQSIVTSAYLQARMLAEGVADADKFLTRDGTKELLKAALPHQSKFIDDNDPSAYHFLLDELKDSLLSELTKMLEGKEADRETIDQAKRITDQIGKMETQRIEQDLAIASADAKTSVQRGSGI